MRAVLDRNLGIEFISLDGLPVSFRRPSINADFEPFPRWRPLAFAVMLACAGAAMANPVGPQVAAGSATFNTSGKTLTVTNTPGTILNWQSFSIGAGELTRFQQQSALSAVLNRVTGSDPSSILGTLSSNGRVFLINPHGIVFGQRSVINTAGFVASTLNMRDEDFLAGRMKFEGGGHGALRNEGAIRASGDIFLVGPQIENAGLIKSDNGSVLLAAGQSVTITSPDAHGVQFALQAPTDAAINLGAIEAKNAAAMFAGTLKHSGEIRATSVSVDASGRVILAAQKDAIVDGNATINVDNSAGKGGSVRITGERVGLFDNAAVSARGTTGGGEILVGGDYQGSNPAVRNAAMTHIASGAVLDASATASGHGGRVIVWADDTTRVHGTVYAQGGPKGGAGGFIETSGKRFLDVSGIKLSASGETAGTWLLDPLNIEVVAGAGTVNNSGAPSFTPGGGSSQIGADLITGLLDANNNVTLNTNVAGGDAGDITINAPIVKSANNSASLTLLANNDITVNQNVTLGSPTTGHGSVFTATAGGNFAINNATVTASNIAVTAGGTMTRSGAQTNDFIYGNSVPFAIGTLVMQADDGAIGSPGNAIRFGNPGDSFGRSWTANTVNAGAAGHIYLQITNPGASLQTVLTDPATVQSVVISHTGTDLSLFGDLSGNDDWSINTAGNFSSCNFGGCAGGHFTLTANTITVTASGNIGASGSFGPHDLFNTSASNGNITLTAATIDGTGCGGGNYGIGVRPGSGTVTATSTGGHPSCGGSIQLAHYGGDLLTSRYVLNFTGGGAGNYMRLKAADGHLIVDNTAGFNASLNDKATLLQTLTAGKDIIFQGGTVQGGQVEVRATRNIDNLAPGTDGFVQTNAFGGPHWMLIAGGGIGLTNPIEGQANWVGSAATSAAGAAGNINIKFTGGSPRFGEIRTDAGSVQNIDIESTVGLIFSTGQPGFGGVLGGGSVSLTANDHYLINATGSIFFDNFNNSFTADTITMTSGGSIVHGVSGGGHMMATTGLLTMNANGGSIGGAANYARLPGTGSRLLHALNDIYIDADANPLSLSGLSTGAGVGTIGLRTTAANDLTLSGTSNINDALVLNIGGNIIFPAAASFTTSGGLTLNSPTQIAATATVNATGGTLSGTGALNNAGTLIKANTGTSNFSGGITNSGTVNVNAGTLDLSGGYTDGGGMLMLGGGAITAPAAGLTLATGTLGGVGTVTGNVVNNGTLSVGASPGTLVINGNFTQGAASTLNVELGGTTQGVNYDLLQVTGTAALDGTLNVALFGGFVGAAGNVFDVLTYASRSGDFATKNFPAGYTMTATPNAALYQLAMSAVPGGGAVVVDDAVKQPAVDVKILNDKFISAALDPGKPAEDEEKKGAVLECK